MKTMILASLLIFSTMSAQAANKAECSVIHRVANSDGGYSIQSDIVEVSFEKGKPGHILRTDNYAFSLSLDMDESSMVLWTVSKTAVMITSGSVNKVGYSSRNDNQLLNIAIECTK